MKLKALWKTKKPVLNTDRLPSKKKTRFYTGKKNMTENVQINGGVGRGASLLFSEQFGKCWQKNMAICNLLFVRRHKRILAKFVA